MNSIAKDDNAGKVADKLYIGTSEERKIFMALSTIIMSYTKPTPV